MIKGNTLVLDRYRILKKIGTGGMSNVYLALDNSLGKKWAIKEVINGNAYNEACIMKEIDHPSLPRIVDILVSDKAVYIIMDYIEGVPLDKLIKKRETIPIDTVLGWSIEIARALDYLHSHSPPIIYKDMKPSNIIVQRSGHIKLIDFGISVISDGEKNKSDLPMGTKGFAAPEQYRKLSKTDQRTDIYSLGITIKAMLNGQKIPYKLSKIIKCCTKEDPKNRYQSCKTLIKAIEKLRRDLEKKRKKKAKNKIKFIILNLSIIIICVIFDVRIQEKNIVKVEEDEVVLAEKNLGTDAILELIEECKKDGEFVLEEEKQLIEMISDVTDSISPKDKELLSKNMGLLYWYYYSLDRKSLHIPSAYGIEETIKWLEQSNIESDKEAKTLYIVAKFNKELIIELKTKDALEYEQYFYALEEVMKICRKEGIKRDRASALVNFSIESYARDFADAGIDIDRVRALYHSSSGLEDGNFDVETETVNEIIERAYDL